MFKVLPKLSFETSIILSRDHHVQQTRCYFEPKNFSWHYFIFSFFFRHKNEGNEQRARGRCLESCMNSLCTSREIVVQFHIFHPKKNCNLISRVCTSCDSWYAFDNFQVKDLMRVTKSTVTLIKLPAQHRGIGYKSFIASDSFLYYFSTLPKNISSFFWVKILTPRKKSTKFIYGEKNSSKNV